MYNLTNLGKNPGGVFRYSQRRAHPVCPEDFETQELMISKERIDSHL